MRSFPTRDWPTCWASRRCPRKFFLILFGMVVVYLFLVELAKTRFYRAPHARTPRIASTHTERLERRIRRRAFRFIRHPDHGSSNGVGGNLPASRTLLATESESPPGP